MKIFRDNGLSIVLFSLFVVTLAGQFVTGLAENNNDREQHHLTPLTAREYLADGHFIEVTFENWESEFLQMSAYVVFTMFLFQRGSSESKTPGTTEHVDVIAAKPKDPNLPWPVRRGGVALKLYENSLSLALGLLFVLSFAVHAWGGAAHYNFEEKLHGGDPVGVIEYIGTTRFWFESFQNWQSEFLSIGIMIVFTIFLRQKGSPESKPVDAPNFETGSE